MTRRLFTASAVLASAMLIASCGQTSDGQANPETQAPPSQAPETPAVAVQNPKDLSAVTDPCALLTPEQLASFGTEGAPETDTAAWGGPQCNWEGSSVGFTVSPNTSESGAFTSVRSSQANFANFTETAIEGYPAARYNANDRTCDVAIATNQEHSLVVNAGIYSSQDSQFSDPCVLAEKVGLEALKSVPNQQ